MPARPHLFLLGALLASTAFGAAVRPGDSPNTWQIETDLLRLELDASRGARVSRLIFTPVGRETVYANGGFCLDHFWEQSWPGEFLGAPYEVSVAQPQPDTVVVTATRTSTGKWGDAPPEPMSNLILTRRLTVADGQPGITVEVSVANPNPTTKMFGYWAQHCFTPAGRQDGVEYFRPGNLGISRAREDKAALGTPAPPEVCYVKHPVAGWTATLDPAAKAGFVFLMDYADMQWLYNCVGMNTTEWMYERAVLPPGKTWSTRYVIRPFTGLTAVAHASPHCIVSLIPTEKTDAVELGFSLIRSTSEVRGGTLRGEVVNLITGDKVPIPPQQFGALTEEPITLAFSRPGPLLHQILVRAEIELEQADGSRARDAFEYFYGGKLAFSGQNLRLDLSPIYVIPAPPKQRRYLKPDTLALVPHEGFRILWVQGMFFDYHGVDRAAGRIPGAVLTESVPYGGLLGEGLKDFPMSYDELMQLDVIVLANLAATAVDDNTAERIKDFVEAGGGLLVFGGPWSLGKGGYAGTKLGNLLPVETVGPADFRLAPAPLVPRHGRLAGLPWEQSPRAYVVQEVKTRAGGEVWLQCGEFPGLVAGHASKGRVAVVALTPMGEPPEGETPWWNWPPWPDALATTLRWLAGKE